MSHYLMQPTWRCMNACSYCWCRKTVLTRPELVHAPERGLDDWARAIRRDAVSLIDIAGGEPCLLAWLPDLLRACPETRFGLSTNGLALATLERLMQRRPHNLVSVNLSYHPESVERLPGYLRAWKRAVQTCIAAGYQRTHCNIVATPANVEAAQAAIAWLKQVDVPYDLSPYEETAGLGALRPQGLTCQGGVNHLTLAPDGSAWPCLTTLRSPYWRETCLGNWLDGPLDLSRKPQPCYLDCADYYILATQHSAGDMWEVQARPVEEGER